MRWIKMAVPSTVAVDVVGPATWIGYLALCLGMFMAILDVQIVASSLPDIQFALHIAANHLSWIQTAYLIAEVVAIPLTGWLTRLMSLRGLFVAAITGFSVSSVGCAVSHQLETLLVYRIIQGFCGGALIPIVFTSVFTLFPERKHVLATTIGGLFAMLAPTIGPVLGGYITENYSWHWLFLINVVPGVAAVAVAAWLIPIGKPDWTLLARLDLPALMLVAACLASLELVLKQGPRHLWNDGLIVSLAVLCPIAGVFAIRRCLSSPEPLIDVRCFADRNFSIGCFYSFVLGMGLFGSVYITPLYLGFVRQHTPFEIGKIMIVMGVAQLATAPFAAIAARRFNPLLLTAIGYGVFAAGLVSDAFMNYDTDFDELLWPQILRGAAVLFCLLPTTRVALEGQPAVRMANASGLFNLMRNLGGAIGIALIDIVLEQRAPTHVAHLVARLQAGDTAAARIVGIPLSLFKDALLGPIDQATKEMVRPLIDRAALVLSFNDAWLMLGTIFVLALMVVPLMRQLPIAADCAAPSESPRFRQED
jgi:MFS transporter, DHA2 family, multidrug resistance protein